MDRKERMMRQLVADWFRNVVYKRTLVPSTFKFVRKDDVLIRVLVHGKSDDHWLYAVRVTEITDDEIVGKFLADNVRTAKFDRQTGKGSEVTEEDGELIWKDWLAFPVIPELQELAKEAIEI